MVICSECNCTSERCRMVIASNCKNCTRSLCCCVRLHKFDNNKSLWMFFRYVRTYFPAALGIEILCISAAVLGENSALYFFGYNLQGIMFGYIMGYVAAGFATFTTILGRHDLKNLKIDSCCSVLEQSAGKGFISSLVITFKSFYIGLSKLPKLHCQSDLKRILKASLIILFTAESACILTAETVDMLFYNYSLLLAIPLALIVGSFTVVAPEAYKRAK